MLARWIRHRSLESVEPATHKSFQELRRAKGGTWTRRHLDTHRSSVRFVSCCGVVLIDVIPRHGLAAKTSILHAFDQIETVERALRVLPPSHTTNLIQPSTEIRLTWTTSMRSSNRFACPVCDFDGLSEPPYDECGCASFEICPSCGTEFGYDDAKRSHDDHRNAWIAAGKPWWSRTTRPPARSGEADVAGPKSPPST
jgi:hypothetical protein